jgi:hypothetical protein
MVVQTEDTMKQQTIAGHKITLEEGERYLCSRPMYSGQRELPVTIRKSGETVPTMVIDGLTYDEATDLINAFNNDPRGSFYGREW